MIGDATWKGDDGRKTTGGEFWNLVCFEVGAKQIQNSFSPRGKKIVLTASTFSCYLLLSNQFCARDECRRIF